jgi:xylan 1,4-beta-xylosidase
VRHRIDAVTERNVMITRRDVIRVAVATPVVAWSGIALAAPSRAALNRSSAEVDWSTTLAHATALSFGLNTTRFHDPAVTTTADYMQNLNYMRPGLLRLHSSGLVNDGIWIDEAAQSWLADKIDAALEPLDAFDTEILMCIPRWPEFLQTYDVLDANGDFVISLLHPDEYDRYAALCAELVRIVNVEQGRNIRLWEPTNERDQIYVARLRDAGLHDRMDELIEIHNRCAAAMRLVDPTIQIGGAAFASTENLTTLRQFVRAAHAAGGLDFVSFHVYGTNNPDLTDEQAFRLPWDSSGSVSMTSKAQAALTVVAEEAGPELPTFWDEYNINYAWRAEDPKMRDHRSAVFDALVLIHATEIGVSGTAAWTDRDRVYGKTDNAGVRRPGADAFQLFNTYLRGRWSPLTLPDRDIVDGCAVDRDADGHAVCLVNKSAEATHVALTSVGADLTGEVAVHTIDATGYAIESTSWQSVLAGVTLAPQSVSVITDSAARPPILPAVPAVIPADTAAPQGPPSTPFLHGYVHEGAGRSMDDEGYEGWTVWPGVDPGDTVARQAGQALARTPLGDIASLTSVAAGVRLRWGQGWSGVDGSTATGATASNDIVAFTATREDITAARAGWQLELPAGQGLRTVDVYVGVTGARAHLTAALSGSGVADYTTPTSGADRLDNSSGTSNYRIRLRYRAASAGETLTITLRTTYVHYGQRSAWIQAVGWTAEDADLPTAPVWDHVVGASDSVTLSWLPSTDTSGVVTHYEVYSGSILAGSTTSTSLRLRGLDRSQRYVLRVAAVDQSGNLRASKPVRAEYRQGRWRLAPSPNRG